MVIKPESIKMATKLSSPPPIHVIGENGARAAGDVNRY